MGKYIQQMRKKNYLKGYLKIKGDQLWISPELSDQEFLLTNGKIALEEVKKIMSNNNQKKLL